jgi:hypothetical protein
LCNTFVVVYGHVSVGVVFIFLSYVGAVFEALWIGKKFKDFFTKNAAAL